MEQEAGYSDDEDHVPEPLFDDIFEAGPSNACEDIVNPAMPLQVNNSERQHYILQDARPMHVFVGAGDL